MNKTQEELYEKLLKKVNEYCLGYAAEDVIAAIDALVESYENKITVIFGSRANGKTIMLFNAYEEYKALEIIGKKQCIHILALKRSENWRAYNEFIRPLNRYNGIKLFDKLLKKEYELLKEVLK